MNHMERKLSICLNKLHKLTTENRLKFSKEKTKCVHFCDQIKLHLVLKLDNKLHLVLNTTQQHNLIQLNNKLDNKLHLVLNTTQQHNLIQLNNKLDNKLHLVLNTTQQHNLIQLNNKLDNKLHLVLNTTQQHNLIQLNNKLDNKLHLVLNTTQQHNLIQLNNKLDNKLHLVLKLNNTKIPVADQYKYLGVIFDCKLSFVPYIKYLRTKCNKTIQLLRTIVNIDWGGSKETLKLYHSLIWSKLTIYHQGLWLALGAYSTSPLESLYAEANEPSATLSKTFILPFKSSFQ